MSTKNTTDKKECKLYDEDEVLIGELREGCLTVLSKIGTNDRRKLVGIISRALKSDDAFLRFICMMASAWMLENESLYD